MTSGIITHSREETQKVAGDLALSLKGPAVITLRGELGAGKTTFTQGLARVLGIKQKIISPTFIIMRKYDLPEIKGDLKYFYHVDLYRLDTDKAIESTGLLEVLADSESIVIIEWPEKMESLLPEKRIDIQLKYLSENEREVFINKI